MKFALIVLIVLAAFISPAWCVAFGVCYFILNLKG